MDRNPHGVPNPPPVASAGAGCVIGVLLSLCCWIALAVILIALTGI